MSAFAAPAVPRQSAEQAWSGRVFRILLSTLSRPGHIDTLPAPDFLHTRLPLALWPAVTLASRGTPTALVGAGETATSEVAACTGADLTAAENAEIVAYAAPPSAGQLLKLQRGTDAVPELGATAIIEVAGLRADTAATQEGGATTVSISGPGVDGTTSVTVVAGSTDLGLVLGERETACSRPPAGIDLWLIDAHGRVLGLPRSSTLTWQENR
ncbi:phosphonate C-P lyase system protein PhnH [Nocardia sp. NPDC059239]|uniref:phosphonate C-P lyase system protein PhnH n=1 Tax=Nocardia sp. NPDC059239 TaxID=3346785 RepID=UPI0036B723D2